MATGDFYNQTFEYTTVHYDTTDSASNNGYFTIDFQDGNFVAHKDREWDSEENSL